MIDRPAVDGCTPQSGSSAASDAANPWRRGFKGSLSIYLALGVSFAAGIAISILLVRGLSQEAYGVYQLAGSILLIGGFLCSLALEKTCLRFGAEFITKKDLTNLTRLLKGSILLRGLAATLFGIILVFFGEQLLELLHWPDTLTPLFPLISVLLFVVLLNRLWGTAFLHARRDQAQDSLGKIITNSLRVCGFIGALWFGLGLVGILAAWLFAELAATVYFGIVNLRWFRRIRASWREASHRADAVVWDRSLQRRLTRFSLFGFLGVNVNVFKDVAVDNFFIAYYRDETQVALYGLASLLAMSVARLNPTSVLRGVFEPLLVGRYTLHRDRKELVWAHAFLSKLVIVTSVPTFLLLAALGDRIIGLLYTPQYLDAVPPLILLCVFFFFVGMTYPFNPVVNTLEKNEVYLLSGLFSIYNVIMNVILVPRYGIIGAALATGSAGLLQFFFYWAMVLWYVKLPIRFPWGALGRTFINVAPILLLALYWKSSVDNVVLLVALIVICGALYLFLAYINTPFNESERDLIHRATRIRVSRSNRQSVM